MGPNKMEEEFRDKLNAREINPSPASWDRLDAMLAVCESKEGVVAETPVRKLNWLYIAAGFIGLLLVAGIFYTRISKSEQGKIQVVDGNHKSNPASVKANDRATDKLIPTITLPAIESVAEMPATGQKKIPNKVIVKKENSIKNEPDIAQNSPNDIHKTSLNPEPVKANIINPAEVNVDELLASVKKPTANTNTQTLKIDANSLLSQVDGELELSFREKVIKSVSKNYKEVKVALANRNNK